MVTGIEVRLVAEKYGPQTAIRRGEVCRGGGGAETGAQDTGPVRL